MMRIGEAAAAAGMTAKTLRFYEEHGLLPAHEREGNGYRRYGDEAVDRLEFIRRGRAAGLTLAQIRGVLDLRDRGTAPCRHVEDLLARQLEELDAQIAELTSLRTAVAGFHDRAAAGSPAQCDPGLVCSYL